MIELKTKIPELQETVRFDWDKRDVDSLHDSFAAHAMRQAIEERGEIWGGEAPEWIESRAEEILASLLNGERDG